MVKDRKDRSSTTTSVRMGKKLYASRFAQGKAHFAHNQTKQVREKKNKKQEQKRKSKRLNEIEKKNTKTYHPYVILLHLLQLFTWARLKQARLHLSAHTFVFICDQRLSLNRMHYTLYQFLTFLLQTSLSPASSALILFSFLFLTLQERN